MDVVSQIKTIEDKQETGKEVNIQELVQKLAAASYSSESEPIQRSMEGSLEYVKEFTRRCKRN
ncbi:hypothetical protein Q5M85_12195 [Paraclostridium bifermentans]|nr:hypothetical protein [Paraclostridium bifermentans]